MDRYTPARTISPAPLDVPGQSSAQYWVPSPQSLIPAAYGDVDLAQSGIPELHGVTVRQLEAELRQGARFVVFQFCISILVFSFLRSSRIYYLRPEERGLRRGLAYSAVSLLCGWWGFPWGLIWTPMTLYRNLAGGKDVTALIETRLREAYP